MADTAQIPDNSLGGFDWLDKGSKEWPVQFRRKWFAVWMCRNWLRIYESSLRELIATDAAAYDAAIDGMTQGLPTLLKRLTVLSASEQLQVMFGEGRKFGLETTREWIESDLGYYLRHSREDSQVFKNSPWSNTKAIETRNRKDAGLDLCLKQYPDDPDLHLALRRIMAIFSAVEIWNGPERSSLRIRRMQRALSAAVQRLCKLHNGPAKLADFVTNLLGPDVWPYGPAGIEIDLQQYFSPDKCLQLVGVKIGAPKGKISKKARALWHVLRAIILRDELRQPFLLLAQHATRHKREGRKHLKQTLVLVLKQIASRRSNQRKVTDALIHFWPEAREMISQKQVASLALALNKKLKLVSHQELDKAPEGKSSVEVQIRRGRAQLKDDYCLD